MVRKNIQPRSSEPGEGKDIIYQFDEKIPVELRQILRINPRDFAALKNSFEEWSKQWD
jgi:hypothetical protein